jgi:hypothetical protein
VITGDGIRRCEYIEAGVCATYGDGLIFLNKKYRPIANNITIQIITEIFTIFLFLLSIDCADAGTERFTGSWGEHFILVLDKAFVPI